MPRIISFDVHYPARERADAVASALRAAGWNPYERGALGEVLADLLMILDAAGGEREVADYLRAADERQPASGLESYLPLAEEVVRAYR